MVELTNRLRKLVASLDDARTRREEGLFKAEGTKCVLDTLGHFTMRHLFATRAWLDSHEAVLNGADATVVKRPDLERMTHMSTTPEVIAVYEIPAPSLVPDLAGRLTLALDRIQDPGNLGTIVRIADWFGIGTVICSCDTVDIYNPKTVQATMGAIARVKVIYTDLAAILNASNVPVYGTFLDGENIYTAPLTPEGVIVMGNEGKGISPEVENSIDRRITIPSFPPGAPTVESLNVGMATAVAVAEFRRRQLISHN